MKIIVMRGVPGSGKSTVAKKLRLEAHERGELPYIVSADLFFTDNATGEYNFDATKLGDAHKFCMRTFLYAVNDKMSPIIVDNTNINLEDAAPYIAVGEALGYEVEVVEVEENPAVAAGRNVHGVPEKKVQEMWTRMQRIRFPRRWKVIKHVATESSPTGGDAQG